LAVEVARRGFFRGRFRTTSPPFLGHKSVMMGLCGSF